METTIDRPHGERRASMLETLIDDAIRESGKRGVWFARGDVRGRLLHNAPEGDTNKYDAAIDERLAWLEVQGVVEARKEDTPSLVLVYKLTIRGDVSAVWPATCRPDRRDTRTALGLAHARRELLQYTPAIDGADEVLVVVSNRTDDVCFLKLTAEQRNAVREHRGLENSAAWLVAAGTVDAESCEESAIEAAEAVDARIRADVTPDDAASLFGTDAETVADALASLYGSRAWAACREAKNIAERLAERTREDGAQLDTGTIGDMLEQAKELVTVATMIHEQLAALSTLRGVLVPESGQ